MLNIQDDEHLNTKYAMKTPIFYQIGRKIGSKTTPITRLELAGSEMSYQLIDRSIVGLNNCWLGNRRRGIVLKRKTHGIQTTIQYY